MGERSVNPNATKEACELLSYLYSVAGNKLISGQHTQTVPCEEITYLHQLTGRKPKLQGFELLGYSPNINWEDASEECLTEVRENQHTVETALNSSGDAFFTAVAELHDRRKQKK